MPIDQYLVTIRVDISRDKEDDMLTNETIMRLVLESVNGLDIDVIESKYIGNLDECDRTIKGFVMMTKLGQNGCED